MNSLLSRFEAIGKKGITVSVVCGYCGGKQLMYSVNVLTLDGLSFDKPFSATTFEQALDIAEIEIKERGWTANA